MILEGLVLLWVGLCDWQQRRIPNLLVLLLICVAAASAATRGLELTTLIINLGLGLAITLPGYIKGVMGGGDVKLMIAISPLWPTLQLLLIFAIGVLVTTGILRWNGIDKAQLAIADPQARKNDVINQADLPLGTAMAIGMCLYEMGNELIGSV